jgi:hypothetical protein
MRIEDRSVVLGASSPDAWRTRLDAHPALFTSTSS